MAHPDIKHCGKPVEAFQLEDKTCVLECKECGKRMEHKDPDHLETMWAQSEGQIVPLNNAGDLPNYVADRMPHLMALAAPFVKRDKSAFSYMVKRNIRHIMGRKDNKFLDCWKTQEGQQSIIYALEEALTLGATIPEMGSLVAFGGIVEFIPAVEGYTFAVTKGANAPFEWLSIDLIYEKDTASIKRVNGEFFCEITPAPGSDRGRVVQVAVYGKLKVRGLVFGEVYPADRLLKKAREHSTAYKYFLREKAGFERARTEGKLKEDANGNKYFGVQMPKRGGNGTWEKKVYEDDLTNPYDGANQPEMLRKVAGKTFLRPFIKVRNSEAAYQEMESQKSDDLDGMIDGALEGAFTQFSEESARIADAGETLLAHGEELDEVMKEAQKVWEEPEE